MPTFASDSTFLLMKKMFSVYVVAYSILLMSMLVLMFMYPKLELHLLLNSYHTKPLDTFFTYYSLFAEGPVYVVALLPLLWKQVRLVLFFGLCELTGGSVLQILKHAISMPRPATAFENCPDMVLPVVEGINMHSGNSFPSGHSSTFFIFGTCCALLLAYHYQRNAASNSNWTRVLCACAMLLLLALAALGAYSRVYLSQHFLQDVCMGSVIGFLTTCLMYRYGRRKILKLNPEETT